MTCLLFGSVVPAAHAQDDEADSRPDVRVEGYVADGKIGPKLIAPAKGTSGTWAILVFLGVLCVGVTFKSGKRTHLD